MTLRSPFRLMGFIVLTMLLSAAAFTYDHWSSEAAVFEPDIRVLDGDTVRVGGQTYRLAGFNTPETGRQAQCAEENALGRAATRRLQDLVAAGGISFSPVPCACRPGTEGTRACNYGRLCASLRADGRDVGRILIAEGLAHAYACHGTSCPRRQSWCG